MLVSRTWGGRIASTASATGFFNLGLGQYRRHPVRSFRATGHRLGEHQSEKLLDRPRKRRVVLFFGYVGTRFKGSQMNLETAPKETVEEEILDAVFKSGGILPTNYPHPHKIGWLRCSRTDKHVHALSNVITLKLECERDYWEVDAEGLDVARRINEHLPGDIRVFSVLPVTAGFVPRNYCQMRKYDFWIPARVLGFEENIPSHQSKQKLEDLKKAMEHLQGHHAFHNFTKFRLYSSHRRKSGTSVDKNEAGDTNAKGVGEDESIYESYGSMLKWCVQYSQKSRVDAGHWRSIHSFSHDSFQTMNDSPLAVRFTITGESFMLLQIRKMMGLITLICRSHIPHEIIPAILSPPSRVNLPLAPPHTLILTSLKFREFPDTYKYKDILPALAEGPECKNGQEAFWDNNLSAEIGRNLVHEDWDDFISDLEYHWAGFACVWALVW